MSIIKLSAPLLKAVGKIFGGADWWLMERYGTKYTAHKNHPRDYKKNPQSKAEKECTLRLAAASKTLVLRRGGFSPPLSLLIPTFAFPEAPPVVIY